MKHDIWKHISSNDLERSSNQSSPTHLYSPNYKASHHRFLVWPSVALPSHAPKFNFPFCSGRKQISSMMPWDCHMVVTPCERHRCGKERKWESGFSIGRSWLTPANPRSVTGCSHSAVSLAWRGCSEGFQPKLPPYPFSASLQGDQAYLANAGLKTEGME